jgi:hypothetical protein
MTTYEIWTLFFQFLAALGTIGAVITALYLSHRSQKVYAKGTISIMEVYCADGTKSPEYVIVSICNIGVKPFKIDSIAAYDNVKKHYLRFNPDYAHDICSKPGLQFLESECGTYIFPKQTFIENLMIAIDSQLYPCNLNNRLKKLRFIAHTNIGQEIKLKVDSSLPDACKT